MVGKNKNCLKAEKTQYKQGKCMQINDIVEEKDITNWVALMNWRSPEQGCSEGKNFYGEKGYNKDSFSIGKYNGCKEKY